MQSQKGEAGGGVGVSGRGMGEGGGICVGKCKE